MAAAALEVSSSLNDGEKGLAAGALDPEAALGPRGGPSHRGLVGGRIRVAGRALVEDHRDVGT